MGRRDSSNRDGDGGPEECVSYEYVRVIRGRGAIGAKGDVKDAVGDAGTLEVSEDPASECISCHSNMECRRRRRREEEEKVGKNVDCRESDLIRLVKHGKTEEVGVKAP